MALANFFDKAALGASQILTKFDLGNFETILEKHSIGIVFDKNAANSTEARATLDLIIRLIARLYPNIQVIDIELSNEDLVGELENVALSINPLINLSKNYKPSVSLIIGSSEFNAEGENFYIGSDGWLAKFSNKAPVNSGKSINPFGAGAAACFGAANVFRFVFKDQLLKGECDTQFSISIFDFIKDSIETGPEINDIHIEETFLVGLGAIGNASIWALRQIPTLTGEITCIDDQSIDLSNLQRYVLARQEDVKKEKVLRAQEFMNGSKLKIIPESLSWQDYVMQKQNWLAHTVAVCVDSAEDRIVVQGSLPKKIFNVWTQQEALGVSRHLDFLNNPCLACLYLPEFKKKSKSETIAESLGLSIHERLIREYLALPRPLDENLIKMISFATGISFSELHPYIGQHIEVFYSEVVCGGTLMKLSKKEIASLIEVPSAFESVLAGILLAAELIIDASGLRENNFPIITRINLLRPLSNYMLEDQKKHHSGLCLCQDTDFQKAYSLKWLSKTTLVDDNNKGSLNVGGKINAGYSSKNFF